MNTLIPNLDILPERQRQIWEQLGATPTYFVLYGGRIAVASLRDIFGMKCATVPQRSEVKDYVDIHALIVRGKIDLAEGIACARAIYGRLLQQCHWRRCRR